MPMVLMLKNQGKIHVKIRWLLGCFICSFLVSSGISQTQPSNKQQLERLRNQRQYQTAQTLQQMGRHQSAISILTLLRQKDPHNVMYYQALLESYLALNQLDKALQLIEEQRRISPQNLRYDIDYGSILYKSGQQEEALKLWRNILQKRGNDPYIYTLVANAMWENRRFDEAIEVYQQAYQRFPDRTYLLQNIANLYRLRMEYFKALKYYLAYIQKEPDRYKGVARQILAFQLDDEQVDQMVATLEEAARQYRNLPQIRLIIAQMYQKYGRYARAYQIYRELAKAKGGERYLLNFADAALTDSAFALAVQAYQQFIHDFPGSPRIIWAYRGAAEGLYQLALLRNDAKAARQALQLIDKAHQQFGNRVDMGELLLLKAQVYRQFYFDLDQAIRTAQYITQHIKGNHYTVQQAWLFIAESYLTKGDLKLANAVLQHITSQELKGKALLLAARIEFWQFKWEEVRKRINEIIRTEGIANNITNDALALMMLLTYQNNNDSLLQQYAQADFLEYQQKYALALEKLEQLLTPQTPPDFRAQIALHAARLARKLGKTDAAIRYYNLILKTPELRLYADEALYRLAQIMAFSMNDPRQAFQLLDRLLAEFPDTPFQDEARDLMQQLRTQNPDLMP